MERARTMGCEKVHGQFSALLEGNLDPFEEERVRKHLETCPDCQRDWERFSQMVRWLHSVEEQEVPEGFLSEVEKRVEERRMKRRWMGPGLFRSMKIPVQAAAMVFIVLLALYLTKMIPFETIQKMPVEKRELSSSKVVKGKEPSSGVKEAKKDISLPASTPMAQYQRDYISEAKPSVQGEIKSDKEVSHAPSREKDEKAPSPPLETEAARVEALLPKETGKAEVLPPEEKRVGERGAKSKAYLIPEPQREITLKISERESALTQLKKLLKQFGGEVVKEEENSILASLPRLAYPEFEKELTKMSLPPHPSLMVKQREVIKERSLAEGTKKREPEVRREEAGRFRMDREETMAIRIYLKKGPD